MNGVGLQKPAVYAPGICGGCTGAAGVLPDIGAHRWLIVCRGRRICRTLSVAGRCRAVATVVVACVITLMGAESGAGSAGQGVISTGIAMGRSDAVVV